MSSDSDKIDINSFDKFSRLIGDFVLVEALGAGSYGKVARCKHKIDGEEYAVKAIKVNTGTLTLREVQFIKNFNHPNIVQYRTSWLEKKGSKEYVLIQTEFCAGGSLRYQIARGAYNKDNVDVVWKILRGTLRGLAFLHNEKNMIHRDIKSDNILLTRSDHAKIADFGLVTKGNVVSLTKGVGTTAYMAPDLLRQNYTNKVDIFSLGVVIFELFNSFAERQPEQQRLSVLNFRFTLSYPSTFDKSLGAELSSVVKEMIRSMLNDDPEQRPSATELMNHKNLADDEPLHIQLNRQLRLSPPRVVPPSKGMEELVKQLVEQKLLTRTRAIDAMRHMDRADFTTSKHYVDHPQSIGCNTTISAPHMHAATLEYLDGYLTDGARVLDVGSGSGFLTACMALMVAPSGFAIGVDHIDELVELAQNNVKKHHADLLERKFLRFICADGFNGYPLQCGEKYDVIHVGGATETIPPKLLDQLALGGRMFIPIGKDGATQTLTRIDKDKNGEIHKQVILNVLYAPLTTKEHQMNR